METETRSTSRPASPGRCLAATATTLVALVAMSASVSTAAVPRDAEVRLESHVVRAVAAAVAAAARDLLAAERSPVAMAAFEPVLSAAEAVTGRCAPAPAQVTVSTTLLGERLLDLPPPAC